MTKVNASGKVEPYTWKAIACTAALSLAAIATELQGIRAVLETNANAAYLDRPTR